MEDISLLSQLVKVEGGDHYFICEKATQNLRGHETSRKQDTTKESQQSPSTNPKDMETCHLSNKEFKIAVLGNSMSSKPKQNKNKNTHRKIIQ